MPAQTVLLGRPLPHEVLAMVDEETQVPLGTLEPGDRQFRFAQGRPGGGEGVDGVALAGLTRPLPDPGHELGWHAHDGLTRGEEVSLEATRQLATVLQRPASLTEGSRPAQQLQMAGRCGPRRALGETATQLVDGHDGMTPPLGIGPDDHHVPCLLPLREGGR
jgi:hypothetical protein